jgi:hypothetical protein
MTIAEGLKAYLEAQVPTAGHGFPLQVPQDATGWSYFVVTDEQMLSHGGGTGFVTARIQIDLTAVATPTASAYKVALGLRELMRGKLDGYRGVMGSVQVDYCKTEISDEWAPAQETPSTRFDVMINYRL